jgi:hypothetical protein
MHACSFARRGTTARNASPHACGWRAAAALVVKCSTLIYLTVIIVREREHVECEKHTFTGRRSLSEDCQAPAASIHCWRSTRQHSLSLRTTRSLGTPRPTAFAGCPRPPPPVEVGAQAVGYFNQSRTGAFASGKPKAAVPFAMASSSSRTSLLAMVAFIGGGYSFWRWRHSYDQFDEQFERAAAT